MAVASLFLLLYLLDKLQDELALKATIMNYFGTRRIRSAGRTSGSIEVTLPAQLQGLEEVECHLTVRDGSRPEIVLQPNTAGVQSLFADLWQKLRLGLREAGETGDFVLADFTLALFPPPHWHERPPLSYIDGFTVLHHRAGQERRVEALARLVAFLAVAAAYRLGLEKHLALAFGDAVAYLITGNVVGLGTDFERGMADRLFCSEHASSETLGSPLEEQTWQQAQAGLSRIYEHFRAWQDNPEAYAADRERWYKALRIEMGNHTSSLESCLRLRS